MKSKAALVFRGLLILIGLTILSGCAGYSITLNGDGPGYDVYKPEPYLLVKPAADKVDATIVWLPNYSQRYRIKTWNFLAKADFEFAITDGWSLTKISDKSDNTTIPSKLLDILGQAAKGAKALTGQPQLFRLVYNEKGEFIGLKPVLVIEESD
jgi:hypothetical protein